MLSADADAAWKQSTRKRENKIRCFAIEAVVYSTIPLKVSITLSDSLRRAQWSDCALRAQRYGRCL